MAEKKDEEVKVTNSDAPTAENSSEETTERKNMVKISLMKDNGAYKDDVFVSVNGENFQIQRGKMVEVPDYVAEVLQHSIEQDIIATEAAKELKE